MRCFFAVGIERGFIPEIVEIQERLSSSGADIKLVEPENLHYTLKFLGDVNDDYISYLIKAISRELIRYKCFNLELRGIGFFGSPNYIRNVWLGAGKERTDFMIYT